MRRLRTVPAGESVFDALRAALAGGRRDPPRDSRHVDPDPRPTRSSSASPSSSRRAARRAPRNSSPSRPTALLANTAASESALGGRVSGCSPSPPTTSRASTCSRAPSPPARSRSPLPPVRSPRRPSRRRPRDLSSPDRFTSLVPAQLATLLDDPAATETLAEFRRVLVGGQAVPAALAERARGRGRRRHPQLRLERVERRVRLRRPPDRRDDGGGRRRRGAPRLPGPRGRATSATRPSPARGSSSTAGCAGSAPRMPGSGTAVDSP